MQRRGFLRVLASILGLGALGVLAYPFLRFLAYVKGPSKQTAVAIPLGKLPVGAAQDLVVGVTPAIIIHKTTGYIVLSRVCTHLGCLVNYVESRQLLICPCHNGTYDLDGNVISGPPPRPLEKIAFKIENNKIEIG